MISAQRKVSQLVPAQQVPQPAVLVLEHQLQLLAAMSLAPRPALLQVLVALVAPSLWVPGWVVLVPAVQRALADAQRQGRRRFAAPPRASSLLVRSRIPQISGKRPQLAPRRHKPPLEFAKMKVQLEPLPCLDVGAFRACASNAFLPFGDCLLWRPFSQNSLISRPNGIRRIRLARERGGG